MKNQKGFSLIELLIVVVIIGIIAAIAIPNLIAARRSANEGSAQSIIRTIHSSQVTYQSTNGGGNFGQLSDLGTAKLIDNTLAVNAGGQRSGYTFLSNKVDYVRGVNPASFVIDANPQVGTATVTQTGTRVFCMATEGLLWQWKPATTGAAQTGDKKTLGTDGEAACVTAGTPAPELVQ